MDVGPAELIIVLVIVLLLFGANRLPSLAKGLGSAVHEFRKGVSGDDAPTDHAVAERSTADHDPPETNAS